MDDPYIDNTTERSMNEQTRKALELAKAAIFRMDIFGNEDETTAAIDAALSAPAAPVADIWDEAYRQGVADERTSEANIGIAGFGAKVNPARQNPYRVAAPAAPVAQQTPAAWLYTLEYGSSIVDRRVSADRLRYPFGVCGADYLRANDDGVSYVRETPLGVIAHGIGQGGAA